MKTLLLTAAFFLFQSVGFSDYAKETKNPADSNWEKYSNPGPQHAILSDLVGKWKVSSKFWMDANAKPEESKGTQTNRLILGGRFLESEHKGTAMGKPFTGKGLLGFDTVRNEYQSVWVDSMSTHIINGTGTYDTATKTLTETGTHSCSMTLEKNKPFRSEYKFTDKKHYTFSMYTKGNDGAEYKSLEINYAKN